MNSFETYSNGKLLLTGEYLVLKGATALALPVNRGQKLIIKPSNGKTLKWRTYQKEKLAFSAEFAMNDFSYFNETNPEKARYIAKLLNGIRFLNPSFLLENTGITAKSEINFNMQWGLGTSSTLINNLAQWGKVNPYELNRQVSKGSGYDIACASSQSPLLYSVGNPPIVQKVSLNPTLLQKLNLVYLNKKQNTENNIAPFLRKNINLDREIELIDLISNNWVNSNTLSEIQELIELHEQQISGILKIPTVSTLYFNDFHGKIKSLGAWGGDFALVASSLPFFDQQKYFRDKGFAQFFKLQEFLSFEKIN